MIDGTDSAAKDGASIVNGIISGVDNGTVAVSTSIASNDDLTVYLVSERAPIIDEEIGSAGVEMSDKL